MSVLTAVVGAGLSHWNETLMLGKIEGGKRWGQQRARFPCFLWKGFPGFLVHLRMRPVSGGNS